MDATDDAVQGYQEGRFFHGYYDGYCFLPLHVSCGDHLLVAWLRPADIDPAKHSLGILKLLVGRLRRAWPDVRIVVRADSGFCRRRLMRWCERHGAGCIVGLARNATSPNSPAVPAMALADNRSAGWRISVTVRGTDRAAQATSHIVRASHHSSDRHRAPWRHDGARTDY